MTATLDPQSASEVYVHALEPRRRSPVARLAVAALDLWCANFGGTFELTRAGDVVVRRRVDGVEELRIDVDLPDDAAATFGRVGEQLETMGPDEFRATWSMD